MNLKWMARDENGKLAVYDSKPDCLPEGARTRVRHLSTRP